MQIVIVCDPGHVDGGAAKVAIASARGLAAAGTPVTFICATGPVAAELDHPGIAVHCLEIESVWRQSNRLAAGVQGIWNSGAAAAVETILSRLPRQGTVVHFHQWTKSFSPSVLAVPARQGLPALVSLHDYFLSCPNGAYYHFPIGVPCQVTPMSGACVTAGCDRRSHLHKAVRVVRQVATGRALAEAGPSLSVLNVSPFAERVIARFIPEQHRRFVLHSPIEVARDDAVAVESNAGFVFVGRMIEEKGVRQLARAARQAGLPVNFVGDGPLLEEIRAMGKPIHCTGWLQAGAVRQAVRGARALVFPSTWYETGGLVVLEALAQGVPVIVSRDTAAADFVVDGGNGFVVDPGDVAALAQRLSALADDAVAQRMGRDAYARYWATPHTPEVHVAGLMKIYENILSEHALRGSTP